MINKKQMLNIVLGLAIVLSESTWAQTPEEAEFEAFLKVHQTEFSDYQAQQNKEFEAFVKAWQDAEKQYLDKIAKRWQDPSLPSQKVWVQYTEELDRRTSIDFETGEIVVELLDSQSDEQALAFAESQLNQLAEVSVEQTLHKDPIYIQANKNLAMQSIHITESGVSKRVDTAAEYMPNKLANNASQSSINAVTKETKESKIQPVSMADQSVLSKKLVRQTLGGAKPKIVKENNRTRISYQLPSTTLSSQAERYLPQVNLQAKRWNLDPALLLAIIQTESSFNPLARSAVPAFGLMQIVPASAGKDVSAFLQGKPMLLSPEYLYKAKNNVEAGSAYVHLLSNRYFKDVRDSQSRTYISIAAYNTGPGNVAKTLSGTNSLTRASIAANLMSSEKIYQLMLQKLPAQETRNYLKKVVKRTAYYEEQLKRL
uniref:Putative lytic transglycosylase n=1 Tax=gamma proteobacterium 1A TaxID=208532 RepID=Q0VJ85_9GAMM|nr:putative lytic transglycosylase [gamma proteobacterium 1A]